MAKKRGIGFGSMLYGVGFGFNRPDQASASIEIGEDATITVITGCAEIGQGSNTALSQIAAEELGIEYGDVRIISADTAVTPDAGPTTASRQTYVSGNAVKSAASIIKKQLMAAAAEYLDVYEDDLTVEMGSIVSRDGLKSMTIKEAAKQLHWQGRQSYATGWYNNKTPDVDIENNQGDAYNSYIYATQMAEVEVDTETGIVKVLRIAAAHDVGKAINPQQIEGQVEGSCAQGLGYALFEDVISINGVVQHRSLAEYPVPTSMDMPQIETYIIEDPDPKGPFGAKGIGEGAIIPTAPAIINAIYNAVGVRIKELPATPEKILKGLGKVLQG